jgi:hypothetical protein
MKRFLLFAGDEYYPAGGWEDFIESFSTVNGALAEAATLEADWFHIVDLTTGEMVEEYP